MFQKDQRHVYIATPWDSIPWLVHGFGTRHSSNWPGAEKLITARQIHSDRSVWVSSSQEDAGEADALITDRAGLLLGVRTADCLPILILAEQPRLVAAVHAGWRGTVAEIAAKTVARLVDDFGADRSRIQASIGPGIGICCYEVGPEVATRFRSMCPERDDLDRKTRIDLLEANRRQLIAAGLAPDRIHTGAPCTSCASGEFHSYRRNPREAGRMLSVIGIRA